MKLRERYGRLTLWNKIGFWGSLASIISLLLAVVFFLISPSSVEPPFDSSDSNSLTFGLEFRSISTWNLNEDNQKPFEFCNEKDCLEFLFEGVKGKDRDQVVLSMQMPIIKNKVLIPIPMKKGCERYFLLGKDVLVLRVMEDKYSLPVIGMGQRARKYPPHTGKGTDYTRDEAFRFFLDGRIVCDGKVINKRPAGGSSEPPNF